MERKMRMEYPGAIYHVLNCGDRREPIFVDDADRWRFFEISPDIGHQLKLSAFDCADNLSSSLCCPPNNWPR